MKSKSDLEDRKAIWIALSELYLDTELTVFEFKHIAKVITNSPFSLAEVKQINKNEVFPPLFPNLLSVAGEWTGFDEKWLIATISKKKKRSNFFKRNCYHLVYLFMKGMHKEDWQKIEIFYAENYSDDTIS